VESYCGDFDVASLSDRPPNDAPERCSLCASASPVWWYIAEPVRNEANQLVWSVALARWWAVCADCDRLIASGAADDVRDRVAQDLRAAAPEVVSEFLLRCERWGRVTS
jgi:hypothetical protein